MGSRASLLPPPAELGVDAPEGEAHGVLLQILQYILADALKISVHVKI